MTRNNRKIPKLIPNSKWIFEIPYFMLEYIEP